jgi:hypothetical protein
MSYLLYAPALNFPQPASPLPRPVILKRVSSVYKKQRGPEGGGENR